MSSATANERGISIPPDAFKVSPSTLVSTCPDISVDLRNTVEQPFLVPGVNGRASHQNDAAANYPIDAWEIVAPVKPPHHGGIPKGTLPKNIEVFKRSRIGYQWTPEQKGGSVYSFDSRSNWSRNQTYHRIFY